MARRLYMSPSSGLKISKPGHDAATTADENLLFSTLRPQLQIVSSGNFIGSSTATNVYFPAPVYYVPSIFCGLLKTNGMIQLSSTSWDHCPFRANLFVEAGAYAGFTAVALPSTWTGVVRGNGIVAQYVVFRSI